MPSTLQTLLTSNPIDKFNWGSVSANPGLDDNFVNSFNAPWDMKMLCINSSISLECVMNLPFIKKFDIYRNCIITIYSIDYLHLRENLPLSFILNNDIAKDWYLSSSTTTFTLDELEENLHHSWDWYELSANPCVTVEFALQHPEINWDWFSLSTTARDVMNFILDSSIPFKWDGLSTNTSITSEFIDEHINLPWNFEYLSVNKTITVEFIRKHIDREWNWDYLSRNPNLTESFIVEYSTKQWDWSGLSINIAVTPKIVFSNPNFNWDWRELTRNPNFTPEIMLASPQYLWVWRFISDNPSCTAEFINNHPEINWNWEKLSANKFEYHPDYRGILAMRLQKLLTKQFKAFKKYRREQLIKIKISQYMVDYILEFV
jgi:hypothetical protein